MDKTTIKAMMSTGNGEQSTPQWLFDTLNEVFDFKIDLCASKKNAKCKKYYSILKGGAFKKKWGPENCFMNPPYGQPQNACDDECIKKTCANRGFHIQEYWPGTVDWIERASKQVKKYNNNIVCLVPARTETRWFKIVWDRATHICFVRGRLCFNKQKSCAPFPSAIVIFGRKLRRKDIKKLSNIGKVISP